MGKIVIMSDDSAMRASYLAEEPLPANYMADYSVLGLLVKRYRDSLNILEKEGYLLTRKPCGADVSIQAPSHILEIQALLEQHGITSEISDIVDSLYQA